MMKCQRALGILGIFENFCGEVLMHKRESGKVSEFLEQFKLGFDHGVRIWSKFELKEI
jgi:hypothetical protein